MTELPHVSCPYALTHPRRAVGALGSYAITPGVRDANLDGEHVAYTINSLVNNRYEACPKG